MRTKKYKIINRVFFCLLLLIIVGFIAYLFRLRSILGESTTCLDMKYVGEWTNGKIYMNCADKVEMWFGLKKYTLPDDLQNGKTTVEELISHMYFLDIYADGGSKVYFRGNARIVKCHRIHTFYDSEKPRREYNENIVIGNPGLGMQDEYCEFY